MTTSATEDVEKVFARYVANALNRPNEAEIARAETAEAEPAAGATSFEGDTAIEVPKWSEEATIVDSKAAKR